VGEFAFRALGAKSDEIIDAENATSMSMSTLRAVPTKASIIPLAVFDLGRGVDVLEGTLLVKTRAELLEEVALGHFGHVVFVEKLAIVAFFAETAQPMLAHHGPITPDVTIRAHGLSLTVSPEKEIADGRGGFVHVREWIGQHAHVVVQGNLNVEDVKVIDGVQYVHHVRF